MRYERVFEVKYLKYILFDRDTPSCRKTRYK
jgi:hypothetical protein